MIETEVREKEAARQREEVAVAEALKAKERQQRLYTLSKISETLAEVVDDPDNALALVVRAAHEATQGDLVSVYLYDENTATFTRGVDLPRGGVIEELPAENLPEPYGNVAQVADAQEQKYEEDSVTPTDLKQGYNIRAFASLPLKVASEQGIYSTVGVVLISFCQPHAFSEEEKEILLHLANLAAIFIAYAEARKLAIAGAELAALGTATATLQHRLANTINITLPAVLRLRYRMGNDPVTKEILDTVERNTLFASDVIRRTQVPLRTEPFVLTDVNALLREAIRQCVSYYSERFSEVLLASDLSNSRDDWIAEDSSIPEIRVKAALSPNLPATYVSEGRMQEVFRVLVENAIKAIYPKSGIVTVTSILRSVGRRNVIEITVIDNGKGIEDKVAKKLFHQPVPHKDFTQGAGLGLWLSNIIVRSNQGSIRLESSELGKGSTFSVHLPVRNRPPTTALRTD